MRTISKTINRPIPSAIDGKQWQVDSTDSDTDGGTDIRGRRMYCPGGDSPLARLVRLHELVHAKISPGRAPDKCAEEAGTTVEAIQWAEDCRVGRIMSQVDGVDSWLPFAISDETRAEFLAPIPAGRLRPIAAMAMADWCMPGLRPASWTGAWGDGAAADWLEAAESAGKITADERTHIHDTLNEIVRSAFYAGTARRSLKKSTGMKKITYRLAAMFDLQFPDEPPPGDAGGRDRAAEKKVERVRREKGWGALESVDRIAMPFTVRPRLAPRRRHSEIGVLPSAVHRWTTDQCIFGTKVRQRGGSILCDASGSMSYNVEDIRRILRDAPAAMVAFYAGRAGAGGIIIAAADGQCADPEIVLSEIRSRHGGGNEIDAPALRWLAKQPGPRFWISDEEVGAAGMDFGKHGKAWGECMAICRAADIRPVPTIDRLKV